MSVIYDALKKLQKDTELKKNSQKDSESSPLVETLSSELTPETILPPPRISKSLLKVSKPADAKAAPAVVTKEEKSNNSTITAALNFQNQKNNRITFILGSILVLLLIFLFGWFWATSRPYETAATPPPIGDKKVEPRKIISDPIVLQGIMSKDDQMVALINDEIYEVGQLVRGRKIINISSDSVQISNRGKIKTIYVKKPN